MLANIFVPQPEPEETLHSVLITAWRLSAFQNFQTFTAAIFGNPSDGRGWSWEYKRLRNYLDPCRVTGWVLLHNTLLLPYLIPFMPPDVAHVGERRLDGDRRLGADGTKPVWRYINGRPLRYCPRCVQLQLARLGRSLWLRPHQLERVDVCWRHSVKLVSVAPSRTRPFLPDECEEQAVVYSFDKSEIWLARQSQELLTGNHPPSDAKLRQAVYREQAKKILYGRQRLDCEVIATHLLRTFGNRFFLRIMGTSRAGDIEQYVRSTISGDDPSIRPINQLLCIHALFGDQRHFFAQVRALAGNPLDGKQSSARPAQSATSTLHRNIFLTELKQSRGEVMACLHERYPLTHEWILKHALSWSRRKLAELTLGPDRIHVLRRRATAQREEAQRARDVRRRQLSAVGSELSELVEPIVAAAPDAIHCDFTEVFSQLRRQ